MNALDELLDQLRAEREQFLRRAFAFTGPEGLVDLQVDIARKIRASEIQRQGLTKKSPEWDEWKYHAQQLRLVCDTIAWIVFEPHTIRNLGRAPGRPPALSSQWTDFEFVLQTARKLARRGLVSIISDLTNILRVGDVIATNLSTGEVLIVECKNTRPEKLQQRMSPRVKRQVELGASVSDYLTTGISRDGKSPPLRGIEARAFAVDHSSEYDWEMLVEAIRKADADGRGSAGDNRHCVVAIRNEVPTGFDGFDIAEGPERDANVWLGFPSGLLDHPTPLHPPPTLWDLPIDDILRIWERNLIVCHAVDVNSIVGHIDGIGAEIVSVRKDGSLQVRANDEEFAVYDRFLDNVILDYEKIESARRQVLLLTATVVQQQTSEPSPSPQVDYIVVTPE